MSTDDNKVSELYQQGNNLVPPEHLDKSILNAAHEAVAPVTNKPSVKVRSPFSGGWPAITSIAALLLITVILVPLVEQEPVQSPASMAPAPMLSESAVPDDTLEMESVKMMEQQEVRETQMLLYKQDQRLKRQLERQSVQRSTLSTEQSKQGLMFKAPPQQKVKKESSVFTDSLDATEGSENTVHKQAVMPEYSAIKSSTAEKSKMRESDDLLQFKDVLQSTPMSAVNIEEKADLNISTAEKWLDKIRQLISNGELDLARQELDEFKTHYPNQKIDQSILDELSD